MYGSSSSQSYSSAKPGIEILLNKCKYIYPTLKGLYPSMNAILGSQRYHEKLCLIKYELDINFCNFKCDYFLLWILVTCAFLIQEKSIGIMQNQTLLNLKSKKRQYHH